MIGVILLLSPARKFRDLLPSGPGTQGGGDAGRKMLQVNLMTQTPMIIELQVEVNGRWYCSAHAPPKRQHNKS